MFVDLIKRMPPAPKSLRWQDYFYGREEFALDRIPCRRMDNIVAKPPSCPLCVKQQTRLYCDVVVAL